MLGDGHSRVGGLGGLEGECTPVVSCVAELLGDDYRPDGRIFDEQAKLGKARILLYLWSVVL